MILTIDHRENDDKNQYPNKVQKYRERKEYLYNEP